MKVQQVLNALHKQKNVGGLQIAMKSISADTAHILTDFLQTKAKWEEIRYQEQFFTFAYFKQQISLR